MNENMWYHLFIGMGCVDMKLTLLIFIALSFIGVVYLLIYISVLIRKDTVIKNFAKIDTLLKKRYYFISDVLSVAQKYMVHEKGIVVDVLSIKAKLSDLTSEYKYINRKIALNTLLEREMKQLISAIEKYPELNSDETMLSIVQIYNEHEKNIESKKAAYNIAARKLRHATDIFPSSFVARMSEIKATDYYN